MRRIIIFDRVSVEGYFAAADGGLNWVVPDDEVDRVASQDMPTTDTILFGRRTYEQFEGFWPHVLDDSKTAPDPHAAGRRSEALRAMALWIDAASKVVFSKSRAEITWRNSRLLREFDAREIETMKREPGKDIIVFGSGSIVSRLAEHDLVDEYRFVVSPLLLGEGRALFSARSKQQGLELLEAKAFSSGNVLLRYARRK